MARRFLSLLTAGGQTIFSKIVFRCPCDDKLKIPYSFLFLFVPALVLFLLGYLLSSKAEQVVTDCCAEDQRGTLGKTKMFCKKVTCSQMTLAALLAPFIWIAMALLEGDYFVCMFGENVWHQRSLCWERNCFEMPCQNTNFTNSKNIMAISQMVGWVLIAVVMVLSTMIKCYICCTPQVGFDQLQSQENYEKKENETSIAESKMERNVKCFSENIHLDSMRIPSTEKLDDISPLIKPTDT